MDKHKVSKTEVTGFPNTVENVGSNMEMVSENQSLNNVGEDDDVEMCEK